MRVRDLLTLLALAAAAAAGQIPATPPAQFRSGTRIVEITLTATRPPKPFALRDQLHPPVNDLKASELRIFDNGIEQAIASFEKIGGAIHPRNGVTIAGDDSPPVHTSFIVLLDGLDTSISNQFAGRDGVAKLIQRLPAGTRLALLAMDDYFRVLQDFSTDRDALQSAISKYERDYPLTAYGSGPGAIYGPPFPMMDPETRLAKSVDALKQVARLAANVRGRKNVLWISTGFPLTKYPGEVRKAVEDLVSANVALYPVSPGGLLSGSDSSLELAWLTGGKAFYGSNDVSAMAESALKFSGEGYLLSFAPANYREDGSFHELKVETSRPRAELHYRIGYVADPAK